MDNEHEAKIMCLQCDKAFKSDEALRSHIDADHLNDNIGEISSDKSSLLKSFESVSEEETLNHNDEHQNSSPFEKTFFNPSIAKAKFQCQPCNQRFSDEVDLMNDSDTKYSQ